MGFVILLCIIICILLITIFVVSIYNKLVVLRNKVKNSWAHIDTQLQRRFDLIPNLVEIVKEYTRQQEELLENVMSIRYNYANATTNNEKLRIDTQLNNYLRDLYDMIENCNELKSNVQFLKLQNALTEIEEDISYARQFYNDAVTIYNNKLMSFPNNIIASIFDFKEEKCFDSTKEVKVAPKIFFKKEKQCPYCGANILGKEINCQYCGTSLC